MYSEKFNKAIKFILDREGGYANNPADSGKQTMYGITEKVYFDWQKKVKGVHYYKGIKEITLEEAKDIYWDFYWEESKAEEFSYPVALVIMDTSVNFGVSNGITFLEESLGLKQTGIMTEKLENLLHENDNVAFALKIVENRIKYRYFRCEEDKTQEVFKDGWINRDNFLREEILKESKAQMDNSRIQSQSNMALVKKGIIEEVIQIAQKYVKPNGESMEIEGQNWGGDVTKFLASVGINYPAPWCNAFTSYCLKEVYSRINYMEAVRLTADTWTTDTWAREKRIVEYDPQRGDLALFYWGNSMPFHISFVESYDGGDTFQSIEGNTNGEGSSEGNTVARKTRYVTDCKFVRNVSLLSGDDIYINYKGQLYPSVVIKGVTYSPIRFIAELLGKKVEWKDGSVFVDGKKVESQFGLGGNKWGRVRDFINNPMQYDNKKKVLYIS